MEDSDFQREMVERVKVLKAERTATAARIDEIDEQLQAWKIILNSEGSQFKGLDQPKTRRKHAGNAVGIIQKILRKATTTGRYPHEIREELLSIGIESSAQVVSNNLFRLKLRGVTFEQEGKHYLKAYEQFMKDKTTSPAEAGPV